MKRILSGAVALLAATAPIALVAQTAAPAAPAPTLPYDTVPPSSADSAPATATAPAAPTVAVPTTAPIVIAPAPVTTAPTTAAPVTTAPAPAAPRTAAPTITVPAPTVTRPATAPTTSAPVTAAPSTTTPPQTALPPVIIPQVVAAPPPAPPKVTDMETVYDALAADPRFATLTRAIRTAGLANQLEQLGPYTILAPEERAFARLKPEDLEALMADPAKLSERVRLHIIQGYLSPVEMAKQLKTKGGKAQVKTLSGDDTIIITLLDTGYLQFSDSYGTLGKITAVDRLAFNGLIIPIDLVANNPVRPKVKKKK